MHIILRKGEVNTVSEGSKKAIVNETHLEFKQFQIAYNSWGHLTIRGFNFQIVPSTKKEEKEKIEDILVILNIEETQKLLSFLREINK